MPAPQPDFASMVRAEWSADATATAWRKWHAHSVRMWSGLTDATIGVGAFAPGQRVLDLAGGAGDPGLTLAPLVAPGGEVVITDLAPSMVAIARDHVAAAGRMNITCAVADAHELPFEDATFDRVTCRLGVMFFWDCARALREVRRVLRPGGRFVAVAWGPMDGNEYMQLVLGPFARRRPLPTPPPGAPGPFRFATPGSLSAELRAAGFTAVHEESRIIPLPFPGTPEELWRRNYEMAAPLRPYFDSFPPEERAAAEREVIAGYARHFDGRETTTNTSVIVAHATR